MEIKKGFACSCDLCRKYRRQGFLKGREWVDFLNNHEEYAVVDTSRRVDFYFYEKRGQIYILKENNPRKIEEIALEEGILPEYFRMGRDLEPVHVADTPYRTTSVIGVSRVPV